MGHFLDVALTFPAVVYTVLLGVSLVYWVFVMIGAAHVNLLGDAADAAADAALDGVAKGALEGATKGMLEGAADHLDGAGGDVDADLGDADGGLMAALKLRSAPATVVMSLVILWAWIFAILGAEAVESVLAPGMTATAARVGILVGAPLLALFPTSLLVRPLAKIFIPVQADRHETLVGKLCTIRTGTVTSRFGEAFVEDGGAGLVVRVRIETDDKLSRGDQALLVSYDEERGEFMVAPMTGLLAGRETEDEADPDHRMARRS